MPDLSMCLSWQCPSRHTCHRNEASGTRPNERRQSWMDFDARRGVADRCDSYWPAGRREDGWGMLPAPSPGGGDGEGEGRS